MTPNFWKYSMLARPHDPTIEVQCHASAWDLYNGYDYRLKMCAEVDESSFGTIHHEMGHIQYDMSYRNQPTIFQSGANSGFHEGKRL
jgi:peptidyl-dipeptidase A